MHSPNRRRGLAHTPEVMQVETALVDDSYAIASAQVRSWQVAYADIFLPSYLDGLNVESRAERWRKILTANESTTYVARQDADVAGFVSFGKCRDEGASLNQGEIWALYVAPTHWGKRFGAALLESAILALKARGFAQISLWVLTKNLRGIGFYQYFGFIKVADSEKKFKLGGSELEEARFLLKNGA